MKRLAVFDFDGTLLKGDSIVRFIAFAFKRGRLPLYRLPCQALNALSGALGLVSPARGKSRALSFLGRMSQEEQDSFTLAFCADILLPRLRVKGLERMRKHREQGDAVLLVSASPDCYLRHMRRLLSLDAVLASPADERGKVGVNILVPEKVKALQAWLDDKGLTADWENSWAYGDSAADLPLMRLCGHPVMVNPKRGMIKAGRGLTREDWRG